MVTYKDRLAAALRHANASDAQLAKHLEVSIQAVRKVAAGTTTAFTAENNSKAARYLRVSPDWLATGEGEMLAKSGWPGTRLTLEQIHQWSPELIENVEKYALFQLSGAQTPAPADKPARNNMLTASADGKKITGKLPTDIKQGRTSGKRVSVQAKAGSSKGGR